MVNALWIKAGLVSAALVISPIGVAASSCKGLVESQCADQENACYWVNSYKRTDGIEVRGHCRTKAKNSVSAAAKPLKASDASPGKSAAAKEPTVKKAAVE